MIGGSVHAQFARYFLRDRRKLWSKCLNFLARIIFNFNSDGTGSVCPMEVQSRSPILQRNAEAVNLILSKKSDKASVC